MLSQKTSKLTVVGSPEMEDLKEWHCLMNCHQVACNERKRELNNQKMTFSLTFDHRQVLYANDAICLANTLAFLAFQTVTIFVAAMP